MPDSAGALLALWNDVDPALEDAYEDWHANEHVPERLTVPGFRWGLRYRAADGSPGPRYLTLYGLADAAVLDGDAYRALLARPTPASARLRPALRRLSRWVCRVREAESVGRGNALALWTLPADAVPDALARLPASLGAPGRAGWLLADRVRDASPLPWLEAGQAGGIDGDALLCAFGDTVDPRGADERFGIGGAAARHYRRLPVG